MLHSYTDAYSRMTDEELLQLARERELLLENAKEALAFELNRRGLGARVETTAQSKPELPRTAVKPNRTIARMLSHVTRAQSPTPDERYCGVRGWLLLFVVYLTIFYPLGLALTLPEWRARMVGQSAIYAWFPWVIFAERTLVIILGALGFYAGVSLWRIWSGAVSLAKFYAILVMGHGVVLCVFLWFFEFQTSIPHRNSILSLVYVVQGVVCYGFLTRSKRVISAYKPDPK